MTSEELNTLVGGDVVYVDKCVFAAQRPVTGEYVRCKVLYFNTDRSQAYVARLDSFDSLYVHPSRISRKES